MSKLYDLKVIIEDRIKAAGLDPAVTRGQIGLKSGRLLAFINANSVDDPESVAKLRLAVKAVLNINA